MRLSKVLSFVFVFASMSVSAQSVQNSFFGYKLGFTISVEKIEKTLVTEYSRGLTYVNENPMLVGTANNLNYAGCKWDNTNVLIFKPDMKFFGVEFIVTGDITTSLKNRYEDLLKSLTEKYGEPEEIKNNCRRWTGKNGVSVELEYIIFVPLSEEEQKALKEQGKEVPFHRVTLGYWDTKVEDQIKKYNQSQL